MILRKLLLLLTFGIFPSLEFTWAQELPATPLKNVAFSCLSPEEETVYHRLQLSIQSRAWSDALPVLARFSALSSENVTHVESRGSSESVQFFSSIGKECRTLAHQIPNEFLPKWQAPTTKSIEALLGNPNSGFPPSRETLRYILSRFPNSAYELECLEILGQLEWERGNLKNAAQAWSDELECRKKWEENESSKEFKTFLLKKLPLRAELEGRLAHLEGAENVLKSFPNSDWVTTMTEIQSLESGVLFEDFMIPEQRGTLFESRVWDETMAARTVPSFASFSPDNAYFAARMGTHVTRWPANERDTRPQAYLVALDVHSEGRLLWIRMPDTAQWAFVGNPVVSDTCVYITSAKWAETPEFYLDVYSAADGTLKYRTFLFSAEVSQDSREVFLPIRCENQNVRVGGSPSGVEIILDRSPSEGNICAPTIQSAMLFEGSEDF